MNKILVFGDIHGRVFWKKPAYKYVDEVDKVIFIGDYLDSYPDEWDDSHTRQDDIDNFLEIIDFKTKYPDKVVLLIGNHDEHYRSHIFNKECGGCRKDGRNANTIKQIFDEYGDYFKLAHEEVINGKKILFTHAGVMKSWYERNKGAIGELTADNLNKLQETKKGEETLCEVSFYRGGFDAAGSMLWSDVRERFGINLENVLEEEFVDEYDLQVFGHTRLRNEPIICSRWACIDCSKPFMIDDKGTILEEKENEED